SLERTGDFRALSWNTEQGGLFARRDAFVPLLESFDADLLFLQEIKGQEQVRDLGEWFGESLPGEGGWHVLVAAEGGDLRSALVSRHPIEPVDLGLEKGSIGAERLAVGLVRMGERKLLALSLHLRCCGRKDSPEDALRVDAAQQIRRALDGYLNEHAVDGVILAGDLNLVGSRAPLEILAGAHLRIADPHRAGGKQMATWQDASGPFLPGRLDYLLYTPGRMRVEQGMVFEPTGTGHASDHLPLIFDFSW
ncbi:MAG: endonuclease/exonuclease/phosphatase family protein, partial [Planctomycetota bacterium]